MSKVVNFRVERKDETEVLEPFKRFVLRKEGKLHGAFGREIVRAMAQYLSLEGADHTHTIPPKNVGFVCLKRYAAVYDALPNGKPFTKKIIETFIRAKAGIHGKTTRREYLNFLLGWGLVLEVRTPQHGVSARGPIEQKYEKGIVPEWMKEALE